MRIAPVAAAVALLLPVTAKAQLGAPNTIMRRWVRSTLTMCGTRDDMSGSMLYFGPEAVSNRIIGYISPANRPNTRPVYRLFSGPLCDHMDSGLAGEGGYTTEFTLGYPYWTAQNYGFVPLVRTFKFSDFDHSVRASNETMPGYSDEFNFGYGLEVRSGTETINTGRFSYTVDFSAGGAITSLKLPDNVEMVNNWDLGRQIQTAIRLDGCPQGCGPFDALGRPSVGNPTEAGDNRSMLRATAFYQNGPGDIYPSPIAGTWRSGNIRTVDTYPVQWDSQLYDADPSTNLISNGEVAIWGGLFRHENYPNYAGNANVMRRRLQVMPPISYFNANVTIERAAALRPQAFGHAATGNATWDGYLYAYFHDIYGGTTLAPLDVPETTTSDCYLEDPARALYLPWAEGLVVSNLAGTRAFGVLSVNPSDQLVFLNFANCNAAPQFPGDVPQDRSSMGFQVQRYGQNLFQSVWYTHDVFIVAGTRAEVEQAMRQLSP